MNNNTTYKDSPLGKIPSDWEVKMIKSIGDVSSGGTPDTKNEDFWNGDINWCTPTDITSLNGSKYIEDTNTKITDLGLKNSSARILPENSVIVCTRATIGKAVINKRPISTNQGFKNIIPTNIDTEFLYYKILNEENGLKRIANGSTFLEVSKTDFDNYHISVPPLPEQIRIAEVLSAWDKAISNMQATIEQVELRNKWLMQELLSGKRRLKGFEKTIWENKKLSNFLNYIAREVPKPSSSFFALGIRCHAKGIFHKNDFEPEDLAMDVLYEVKENDLIVNITFAWEHAIAIAGKQDDGGLVSHRFPTYTFKTKNAIPEFFRYFILQKKFKYQLDLISPGGAGRNRVMSKKDFPKIEVTIPSVEEQKAIANILDNAFNELSLLRYKRDMLKEQKKGLMQVLLTGKKRLKIKELAE